MLLIWWGSCCKYPTVKMLIQKQQKQHNYPERRSCNGCPLFSILSEIFLLHAEHSHLPRLKQKHKIFNYFRYIDDILLIYDSSHTNIKSIFEDFNSIHPNLTFSEEIEQNNKLNFSQNPPKHKDVSLKKTHLHWHIYPVHIQPTTTI